MGVSEYEQAAVVQPADSGYAPAPGAAAGRLRSPLDAYEYRWPRVGLDGLAAWRRGAGDLYQRELPETLDELAGDSRWPALFPAPICFVTTGRDGAGALEKVVGASIVNRFPYVVALSFCRTPLSERHHPRTTFMQLLEQHEEVAVQFLPGGDVLDRAMAAIAGRPDGQTAERLESCGLGTRPGRTVQAPVFEDAYLVYEARLVKPGRDFEGAPIYAEPWTDTGSHRVYYFEITAIQLREDIATGRNQIHWRSLPAWSSSSAGGRTASRISGVAYQKGYTANYSFPSPGTIQFEADERRNGMRIKHLPPLAENQVEVDNDRARWPCFFPSSVGMITTWAEPGLPNVMPCGSTTVVSRHPLMITPCVSYAAINERYAKRATLDAIRRTGRFGCGVPYVDDAVLGAIRYCGNISINVNRHKVRDAGLEIEPADWAPVIQSLPVHFDCEVVDEVRLGTHIMFLGEVRRIRVRPDVTPANPLAWCPWAEVPARPGLTSRG